jgi:hypothetical protein
MGHPRSMKSAPPAAITAPIDPPSVIVCSESIARKPRSAAEAPRARWIVIDGLANELFIGTSFNGY